MLAFAQPRVTQMLSIVDVDSSYERTVSPYDEQLRATFPFLEPEEPSTCDDCAYLRHRSGEAAWCTLRRFTVEGGDPACLWFAAETARTCQGVLDSYGSSPGGIRADVSEQPYKQGARVAGQVTAGQMGISPMPPARHVPACHRRDASRHPPCCRSRENVVFQTSAGRAG